jgi:beta-galactosidase
MYPTPSEAVKRAESRPEKPFMLVEYTHAMGNSNGALREYWDFFYSGANTIGAFVWDWADQGIRQPVPQQYRQAYGKDSFIAYGGWWENPAGVYNDNNFCMNGLVGADRDPHAGLWAIKHVYRNLHASFDPDSGLVEIGNRFDFVNPAGIAECRWKVQAGGETLAEGILPELDISPHQSRRYRVPIPEMHLLPGTECFLNLSFVLKHRVPWAEEGHEISWEQFKLPATATAPDPTEITDPLTIDTENGIARFHGRDFSMTFDTGAGVITDYVYKGVRLLERGPLPDFWRAMTDNDRGAWRSLSPRAGQDASLDYTIWRDQASAWRTEEAVVQKEGSASARIDVKGILEGVGAEYKMTYLVFGNGEITVECSYEPGEGESPMMPRFGSELILSPGLENMTWYGRGPAPTYIDRDYERVGIYNSTVEKEWNELSRPQENSNKTDVRWVAFTNEDGVGLKAVGFPVLSVGAYHFSKQEMEEADYAFRLPEHGQVWLNLDWKQMGVGGVDSWTTRAFPLPAYQIDAGRSYDYRYRLSPIEKQVP